MSSHMSSPNSARLKDGRPSPRTVCAWLSVALLASPLLLAGASAQNQAQPKIAVESKIVSVYATVRDKHGKIVSNLNKGDFTLTEDGRPETITNFARESDLPLTLGLLVDTSRSQTGVLGDERKASYAFLDHMLSHDKDRAFLIHFDREVELLQDLTSSRQKLQTALGLLNAPELERADDDGSSQRHGGGGGTLLYDAIYLASNELMKKQQGRKALIVLTDGVDRGSKETLEDAVESAQRADTVVYSILFAGHEGEEHRGGYGGHHGGMGGGWPGGGGGGGGYPRRNPEQERPDGKKVLERISTETGGQLFEVTKKLSVDDIYSQIEEGLRNQYVLGYPPDQANAAITYHKIQVTTNQKDLIVHARDGYYSGT